MLEAITIAGTGRERERDFQIATGIGQATPSAEIYHPVLERLAAGPLSMRELRAMPHMQGQAMSEASVPGYVSVLRSLDVIIWAHVSTRFPGENSGPESGT